MYFELQDLWSRGPLTPVALEQTAPEFTALLTGRHSDGGELLGTGHEAVAALSGLLSDQRHDKEMGALAAALGWGERTEAKVDDRLAAFALSQGRGGAPLTARRWAQRGMRKLVKQLLVMRYGHDPMIALYAGDYEEAGDWYYFLQVQYLQSDEAPVEVVRLNIAVEGVAEFQFPDALQFRGMLDIGGIPIQGDDGLRVHINWVSLEPPFLETQFRFQRPMETSVSRDSIEPAIGVACFPLPAAVGDRTAFESAT